MRARLSRPGLLLSSALLLAGCTIGPNYTKPDVKTPDSFTLDASPLSVPQAAEADLTAWWTQFHDAELNSLVTRALATNLDLQSAASRVRAARQQEIIAGAAATPSVSASGNAAHLHSGRNLLSQLGGGNSSSSSSSSTPASGGTDVSIYSAGFDASWELDVFGGVRRGVEAAKAGSEAAHWQMRDGEVTLTAEIAADYIALRAAQARLALLQGQLNSQNATLDLVSARAKTGFVTDLDVNQQYALKASTEAQIPSLEADVTVNEHAIAVLLAADPNSLTAELNATAPLPDIPATLPVGLPSDLLRRRPDIREAERKLAQATAEQGVAIAALYPKFSLTGYLTLSSNTVGGLFNSTSLSELGLASISWPIFHGGEAHANIAAKDEERQQAYLAYQKAVLAAVQDADDALARFAAEQRRFVSLNAAVTRDQSSTAIAAQQYQAGLTTYINVLTAQSTELQATDQLAQSKQAMAMDIGALYKALGGGWRDDDNDLGKPAPTSLLPENLPLSNIFPVKFSDLLRPAPAGLYCPPGDFYIDPVSPVERAVITHGHGDHARSGHGAVLATKETLAIMAARYGADFAAAAEAAPYGVPVTRGDVKVTLHPAGHILGSAQCALSWKGMTIVVSGDYKRRRDPTCRLFEPVPCDVFVSEATFGLPVFRHPPDAGEIQKLLKSLQQFPERSHLVGAYALGKAQRVISLLREAGYGETIYVHGALTNLNALYESFGVALGPLAPATTDTKDKFEGRIVIAPPAAIADKWARRFADPLPAFASGWMRVRARARQRHVELPLILSDHGDWDELTSTFEELKPQEVWLTHGNEEALLRWSALNGIDAKALSLVGYEDEEA